MADEHLNMSGPAGEFGTLSLGDEEVPVQEERRSGGWSYRMKLGKETIRLNSVEFRILAFLAEQPYRAYTRQRIAKAISTSQHPILADDLDNHVASLRDKLGFFRDYIQTVPYIGYRFKA